MAKVKQGEGAVEAKAPLEVYNFPEHNISVEAENMEQAIEKLEALL